MSAATTRAALHPETETNRGGDRNDLSRRSCNRFGVALPDETRAAAPVELRVEFLGSEGPVSGTVSAGDGPPRGFHGWLELMDALELGRSGGVAAERGGELPPRADA
jgi:hypothetical protein